MISDTIIWSREKKTDQNHLVFSTSPYLCPRGNTIFKSAYGAFAAINQRTTLGEGDCWDRSWDFVGTANKS